MPEIILPPLGEAIPTPDLPVGKEHIAGAIETLKKYKEGKRSLEERIVEEERWWKLRHWEVIRGKHPGSEDAKRTGERPEPASAWLFNSLTGKHADLMDNFPQPNVLPREQADEKDAETLSAILPVIQERSRYEKTYSDAGWYKLKHGVSAKGVFWNKGLENGLGDIDIPFVDMLNLFWEPGITDLQDSRNLFLVSLRDTDLLQQEYPWLEGEQGRVIDLKEYVYDDQVDTSGKSLVVDWYYKKTLPSGRRVLHLCKFTGETLLFASENQPEMYPRGIYDHGQYPVVLDVLFPEEGTPVGFGWIAVMKSPQMYIDKLSQAILENTVMAVRPRYWGRKDMGINRQQFLDLSEPIVEVETSISEEKLQPIQVPQMSAAVLNVLQMKIDELKETSSNRDVSQGSSSGGVTAAAAIAALQEAGNKVSRDAINGSYRAYTQENHLQIELVRQFYDDVRAFRIVGRDGGFSYIRYSNRNLKGVPIPPAYPGQEQEPSYVPARRRPVFDIVIRPQKRSPYSKMAQNELAKELYQLGFFNPKLAQQSLAALELMDFDGDSKVRRQVQQGQTLKSQLEQMEQMMRKMGQIVERLTGQDVFAEQSKDKPETGIGTTTAGTMAKAQKQAVLQTMTDHAGKMISRALPGAGDT